MPAKLQNIIQQENESNRSSDILLKLVQCLSKQDNDTSIVCHSSAVQITILSKEGNTFCAYRNIQMLLLSLDPKYIPSSKLPDLTIPALQRAIESAWDAGYNVQGRIETGGIIGTRKYIGTSEAQALFQYLRISCTGQVIQGPKAAIKLMDFVKSYFSGSMISDHVSGRPPIFLQRPGHSVTIVGYVKTRRGDESLLVFDPARQVPGSLRMSGPLNESVLRSSWAVKSIMWQYRRKARYFARFSSFEVLSIDMTPD